MSFAPSRVVGLAYLAGTVPVTNLVARARYGADLRESGSGTVSGTALYELAGFGPLAAAGLVELAKGALGPLLAGRRRPALGALAAAGAIAGHNWSPWLGLRGGRGVSLALGASLVLAPAGALGLLGGLTVGRFARQTGLGTLVGLLGLPLAARRPGRAGALPGALVVLPILLKRLLGNETRLPPSTKVAVARLVGDRDDWPRRASR